jgi:hypothetical protein
MTSGWMTGENLVQRHKEAGLVAHWKQVFLREQVLVHVASHFACHFAPVDLQWPVALLGGSMHVRVTSCDVVLAKSLSTWLMKVSLAWHDVLVEAERRLLHRQTQNQL